MKTINNTVILDAGDIDKPEYRAAARAALEAGGSVSIPGIGLALNMPNNTAVRLVDLGKGIEKTVSGVTATAVLDKVASYKTADRILAALKA